jgi:hypothetical protein
MFVIVETFPTYCPSTDAMIGSRSRIAQAGIVTEAWARARAGILEDSDRRHCGDSIFQARPASDPFRRYVPPIAGAVDVDGDDLPF